MFFINYELTLYPDSLYAFDGAAALFVRSADKRGKAGLTDILRLLLGVGAAATAKAVIYMLKAARYAKLVDLPPNRLVFLAVDSEYRSKGLGSAAWNYFRAKGAFVLETHSDENVKYYIKQGGKVVVLQRKLTKNLKYSIIVFEGAN